jgi:outer membrane protein
MDDRFRNVKKMMEINGVVIKLKAEDKKMKKVSIFFLGAAFLMALIAPALADEPLKIAYVDMQKALNQSEVGKEAKKIITQEVEKMEKSFSGKQKELEKLREDLEKRGAVMSESVRKEKERDYQTRLRDLQRLQRDYEDDLRRKDRELTERILKDLDGIVKKIGEERKFTIIFEKNQPAVVYISNTLDLTDEVIKILNEKRK